MTPQWKELVLKTMRDRGMSRARLASELGVRRGMVTKLFDKKNPQRSSAFVPKICKLLGVAYPMQESLNIDEREAKIFSMISNAPDSLKDHVLAIVEAILSKPR